jgi:BirA family transcriptional regulator, biotin operon repressor / biotin---[acetyl-CoA-carboxylase] ligase
VSWRVEPLPIESLSQQLAARGARMGCRLEYHDTIASTNDRARELADAGEPEGTAVLAGEQTRGRGRSGRSWHSAPGLGIYLSVILRPRDAGERLPLLTLVAAVGAASGVREATGVDVRIKWPNDLVVSDGGSRLKLGGILTEGRTGMEGVRDVVVGVGVNVNHEREDFPTELRGRACSLKMERGRQVDRGGIVLALLEGLERWYRVWRDMGDEQVLTAYRDLGVDLQGRAVRVTSPAGSWTGVTEGLAGDGALLVRPDGAGADSASLVGVRFGEIERVEEA